MITLLCVAREESQSDGQTGGHDDSRDTARKMGMATKGRGCCTVARKKPTTAC
jgi:hypothetical protein